MNLVHDQESLKVLTVQAMLRCLSNVSWSRQTLNCELPLQKGRLGMNRPKTKVSRQTLPGIYVQQHTWALTGVGGLASMALLADSPHRLSSDFYHTCYPRLYHKSHVSASKTSWELDCSLNITSTTSHSPLWDSCRIPTLLHTVLPPRSSSEVWMEASNNSCTLHWINQHHMNNVKVCCQSAQ